MNPTHPTDDEPREKLWERLPMYLIEHYEGEPITEELIQQATAELIIKLRIPSPDAGTGTAEETPETDAHCLKMTTSPGSHIWASAKFARSLEKRLNAALADNAALRAIINELAEKRTDPHGFYYVSRHMGGMGSELSQRIDAARAVPKREGV